MGDEGPTGGDFLPVVTLEKGNEVANLVDFFDRESGGVAPVILRGNAKSSFNRDLGVSVSAFPHLKQTATAWSGSEGGGYPRGSERHADVDILVLRGVWLGGVALDAQALVPRLSGATLEARRVPSPE